MSTVKRRSDLAAPQRLTVFRSLDALAAVETDWLAAQQHPNIDYEQFVIVCRTRPEVIAPHVVRVGAGRGGALLVARLESAAVAPPLGYSSPFRVPARVLQVLHQGLLGHLGTSEAGALAEHLWDILRSRCADMVHLHQLDEHSPIVEALLAHRARGWLVHDPRWNPHWALELPEQAGGLVLRMKSKHRSWLRRKQRELEQAFPDRVRWQWKARFESVQTTAAALERVASKTYQRALGAGFFDDEEHRARLALFARQGRLRLGGLEFDGELRAYWLGVVYGGQFHSWATGYDPALRSFEPGNLMFHRMVDELVGEGVKQLDFGLGDAFYKQRFGDRSWRERSVRLFAPTAKGAALMALVRSGNFADATARRVIGAFGGLDWLKTRWRRHLVPDEKVCGE